MPTKPFAADEIAIDPRAFGAAWDGVTDDTAAIQAAIDYALNNASRVGDLIWFPEGSTIISDTILIESATGLRIVGHGRRTTLVTWDGPAGIPGFKFDGTSSCELSQFRLTVADGTTLDTAVEIGRDVGDRSSSLWASRELELILGGKCGIGIYIRCYHPDQTSPFQGDSKNDHHWIYEAQIQAYTDTAVVIEGYNAKKIQIIKPLFQGRSTGQYGIDTARLPGHGGSFVLYGGQVSENDQYDFRFGKPNDPIVVDGCYGQAAARWWTLINDTVEGPQPTGFFPITFRGHKWSSPNSLIAADHIIVNQFGAGPVVLDNCKIGGNSGNVELFFNYLPRKVSGFATGTLNITGAITAGETVTLGIAVYTWRAVLVAGGLPFEVLIGATVSDSIFNLVDAINLEEGGEGVVYGTGTTINTLVSGSRLDASNMRATALDAGVAGNLIVSTETMANALWTNGATLSGGAADAFENIRGTLAIINSMFSCATDPDDFFTALPPDDLTGSLHYDSQNAITPMIDGLSPYEAGFFLGNWDRDWTLIGLPVPRIWHDCSSSTGFGEGLVLDKQKRYSVLDLHPTPTPADLTYGTIIAPWTKGSIEFDNAASLSLNFEDDDNLIDPQTMNVAIGFHGILGTPASDATLIILGGGASGANQGPFVRQRTDGMLQILCNGASVIGTVDYDDGDPHTIIALIDRGDSTLGIPPRLQVITDMEIIDFLLTNAFPATVQSISGKGIGTSSGGGVGPECSVREVFCWTGPDVSRIQARGTPGAWEPGDVIPLLRNTSYPAAPGLMTIGAPDGLQITRTSASQVGIATGSCFSTTGRPIKVTSALTADITVAGANGLDAGGEAANTWYSVWVIGSTIGSLVASLLSTSATAPVMPAGYDLKRRVGWVRNNAGSDFQFWNQRGNGRTRTMYWDEARSVISVLTGGSATAFTDVDLSALVPPNCDLAYLLCGMLAPTVGGATTDSLELRPNGANASDGPWSITPGAVLASTNRGYVVSIPTDANRVIEYRVTDADDDADLWVLGYDDEL